MNRYEAPKRTKVLHSPFYKPCTFKYDDKVYPSRFELLLKKLGIAEDDIAAQKKSPQVKEFCKRRKNSAYIPTYLLEHFKLPKTRFDDTFDESQYIHAVLGMGIDGLTNKARKLS